MPNIQKMPKGVAQISTLLITKPYFNVTVTLTPFSIGNPCIVGFNFS